MICRTCNGQGVVTGEHKPGMTYTPNVTCPDCGGRKVIPDHARPVNDVPREPEKTSEVSGGGSMDEAGEIAESHVDDPKGDGAPSSSGSSSESEHGAPKRDTYVCPADETQWSGMDAPTQCPTCGKEGVATEGIAPNPVPLK